jgi:hypothetical protein
MISDTGEAIGYTIMSGSNPRLNERTEKSIVKGETKTTDKAIVATITASNGKKSIIEAFQRITPNIQVPAPTLIPLTRANVITTRRRVWKSFVFLVKVALIVPKCNPVPRCPLKRPPTAPLTLRMPGNRNNAHGAWSMEITPRFKIRRVPVNSPIILNDNDKRD